MWIQAGRKKDMRKIEEFDEAGSMDPATLKEVLERFGLIEKWRSTQGGLSDEYRF